MPKITALTSVWNTVKEIDLRPLRQQALNGVRIALVGDSGSGRHTLAEQMRRDPHHPQIVTDSPLRILSLEQVDEAVGSDLLILVVDERKTEIQRELEILQTWANAGQRSLVFVNQLPAQPGTQTITPWSEWRGKNILLGSALDSEFLRKKFASAVIEIIPQRVLALGRYFPLFRLAAAQYLINDACLSNTAYSFTTGLAEIVPVFDIPLTVTDMIVLSKTQAFLAYKLGLALGYSTSWQDYVNEFGGVLGGGFLWRQLARSLIGLVPLWGILPKVAVAYAGTYVVGHAVLQWYLTGRHLTASQMRALYKQAFARGKNAARSLVSRRNEAKKRSPRLPKSKRRALPAPAQTKNCPNCGQSSAMDANFCQYCGYVFRPESGSDEHAA